MSRVKFKFLLCLLLFSWSTAAMSVPDGIEESVVRVLVELDTDYGTGSGAFIAEGIIVTNSHVISGATSIAIISEWTVEHLGGQPVAAEVLWESRDLDLALLSIKGPSAPALPLAVGAVSKGSRVWALGFPAAVDRGVSTIVESTLTAGVVGKVTNGKWVDDTSAPDMQIVQHDATISPGNSGGPLFDDCGRIIGVNTALHLEYQGYSLAGKSSELLPALKQLGIRYKAYSGACSGSNASDGISLVLIAIVIFGALSWLILHPKRTKIALAEKLIPSEPVTNVEPAPIALPPVVAKPQIRQTYLELRDENSERKLLLFSAVTSDLHQDRGGMTLGRSPDLSNWSLDFTDLSRRHFRCTSDDQGSFWVEDLNSANGTELRGKMLDPFVKTLLNDDDLIRIGTIAIRLRQTKRT